MRRPDGGGTKETLPSGKIRVRTRTDGQRTDRIFADEAAADAYLRGVQALLAMGETSTTAPTLAEWGRRWLDTRHTADAATDQGRWRHHVEGTDLGSLPPQDVRPADLRAWAERELPRHRALVQAIGGERVEGDEPISVATRRHCVALVRRVFQAAVEAGVVSAHPLVGMRFRWPDETTDDEVSYLEEPQVVTMLSCEAIPLAARLHYGWAIGAGPRQGESWALRWRNLDLAQLRGEIRQGGTRATTKGGKVRRFALLPLAVESLQRWREIAPSTHPDALVWPAAARKSDPRGGRQRGKGDDYGWADRSRGAQGVAQGHRSLAGLPDELTYHALRHTACAGLLRGYEVLGVTRRWTLDEVCDWIGHSGREVTEIYAHIVGGGLGDQAAAASRGPCVVHGPEPVTTDSPVGAPGGIRTPVPRLRRPFDIRAALGVTGAHGPAMDHGALALALLQGAARGAVPAGAAEALARAVLADRRVRLAQQVLEGGEFAMVAALELAGLVRAEAAADLHAQLRSNRR